MRRAILTATAALALGVAAAPANATFPGENGLIAFARDGDIWTTSADGTDQRRLTETDHQEMLPAWSPDGRELMFTRLDPGQGFSIWRIARDGATPAAKVADGAGAVYAPDGKRIAYGGDRLTIANRDGSDPTPIGDVDQTPRDWSPVNDLVLYEGGTGFSFLAAQGPNGGLGFHLPHDHDDLTSFGGGSWSPDGTRIALYGERDGESPCFGDPTCPPNPDVGLQVMGLDSRRIVIHPEGKDPSWSPDGSKIAFVKAGVIHTVAPDGTGLETVTSGDDPSWQPLPKAPVPPHIEFRTLTETVGVPVPGPERQVVRTHEVPAACPIPKRRVLTLTVRLKRAIGRGAISRIRVDLRSGKATVLRPTEAGIKITRRSTT